MILDFFRKISKPSNKSALKLVLHTEIIEKKRISVISLNLFLTQISHFIIK
jgi:hypothetical protein